jgi:hypothetical protein
MQAFIVSCGLEGVIAEGDTVVSARLVLTSSFRNGINPLGPSE